MNPSYDFTGQVAFVTGAGSGMGLATARAFAEAGAAVTLADADDSALAADEPAEVFDRVNGISLRGIWASHQPARHRGRGGRCRAVAVQPGASFVIGVALPVDGGYTAR